MALGPRLKLPSLHAHFLQHKYDENNKCLEDTVNMVLTYICTNVDNEIAQTIANGEDQHKILVSIPPKIITKNIV